MALSKETALFPQLIILEMYSLSNNAEEPPNLGGSSVYIVWQLVVNALVCHEGIYAASRDFIAHADNLSTRRH
jgi:hypothetical protein